MLGRITGEYLIDVAWPQAICDHCGLTEEAKLVGPVWVLVGHDAPVRRIAKGKGTKQPTGKLCVRGRYVASSFKTGNARQKRRPSKGTGQKR